MKSIIRFYEIIKQTWHLNYYTQGHIFQETLNSANLIFVNKLALIVLLILFLVGVFTQKKGCTQSLERSRLRRCIPPHNLWYFLVFYPFICTHKVATQWRFISGLPHCAWTEAWLSVHPVCLVYTNKVQTSWDNITWHHKGGHEMMKKLQIIYFMAMPQ